MIKKVTFSNFYSFYSEQKIDFTSKKKNTYDYYTSISGEQITKVAGFIGGNASGKTNVMRLFSFLGHFVCKGKKDDSISLDIAYKTYFNNNEPSVFSIEFEENNTIFFYEFTIEKNRILKEELKMKELKSGSTKIKLFSREVDSISLNKKYFKGMSEDLLKKIRADISLIAFIKSQYSVAVIDVVYEYFYKFKTNINEQGAINNIGRQITSLDMYLADNELKAEMEAFISNFDIGLKGIDIKKEPNSDGGVAISVKGVHLTDAKENKLNFIYESRGTQSLIFTLANILSALKNENVAIVDEIETGLHPEAVNKIISYFVNENKNKKAQIIFSSHSLGFMNKFDMHQIFLVEKDQKGRSSLCRLNQIKGVRSDENFLAKYMVGAYGAFPKIQV